MFVVQTGQWRRLYLLNIFNKYVQKENPLIPFVSFPHIFFIGMTLRQIIYFVHILFTDCWERSTWVPCSTWVWVHEFARAGDCVEVCVGWAFKFWKSADYWRDRSPNNLNSVVVYSHKSFQTCKALFLSHKENNWRKYLAEYPSCFFCDSV